MAKISAKEALRGDAELFNEEFLKKLEYLYVVSRKLFQGLLQAQRRVKKVGSGVEFADHRTYSPGDDMRYLDWSVYGRSERLLLRLFQEEEDLSIYLLPDISASMQYGEPLKVNYAKQVAAALAYVGLANLDRVGIIPFSGNVAGRLPPSRGKGQIFKILDFLRGSKQNKGQTDTLTSARNFVHQNKKRGLAVVISDFYDPKNYQEGLNYLRYHKYDTIAVHVYDPTEATPDLSGDLEIVDCETGETRPVTITAGVLAAYQKEHAKYLEEVKEFCRKHQIQYVRAPTTVPFDELILKIFREGGLVER
jgi:uncharacterized protein (DUF58 family)